jgi:hypothetical protein
MMVMRNWQIEAQQAKQWQVKRWQAERRARGNTKAKTGRHLRTEKAEIRQAE